LSMLCFWVCTFSIVVITRFPDGFIGFVANLFKARV
jgi:hypothetical protein